LLVGIHQPHYLPWLRYFEKIARSDVFIVLDTVQFSKNGWQNRNKIKTREGAALLTVPVHASIDAAIVDVSIDNCTNWCKKHLMSILQNYARAPYVEEHRAFFQATYGRTWNLLCELDRHMLEYYLRVLEIETPIRYASELKVDGSATERLINLIRSVGGTGYYSGAYALDVYLDAQQLGDAGIELVLQEWKAPVYPQLHGPFVADLSIVDLLMNCGPESTNVLLGTRS
jgi:hypothetical protein